MDNSTKCISDMGMAPLTLGIPKIEISMPTLKDEAIPDQVDAQSELQMDDELQRDDEIQRDGNEPMMDGDEPMTAIRLSQMDGDEPLTTTTIHLGHLGSLSTKDCLKVRDGVSPCWITAPRGFNARTADPFSQLLGPKGPSLQLFLDPAELDSRTLR